MSSAISQDSATTLFGSLANFCSRGVAASSDIAPIASAASCRTIWFSSRFSRDAVREGRAALLAHCPSTKATSWRSTALEASSRSTLLRPSTASSLFLSRRANRLPYLSNRRTVGSIRIATCWSTERFGSAGGAGSMLTYRLSDPSLTSTSPAASFFLAQRMRSSASWHVWARGSHSQFSNSSNTLSASSARIAPSASAASCRTMLSSSPLRALISTGTALASSFCPSA
mmetsp:Transcript_25031/g.48686  ORF Transcript_25031/g.48686 Transcript_25031/m.48686 type:complete len:229 (-) Transcript_25031:266-952(-)